MISDKLANDASSSTRGTIYQIYVALHKCFEMTEGQQILIERYGDVTVNASQQLEVKHFAEPLTDNHINFWKTLYNWMQDSFQETEYTALVLCTTQRISEYSLLKNWNAIDVAERLAILAEIHEKGETREQLRNLGNNDTTALKSPESLRFQRYIMDYRRNEKLQKVIERFTIADQSPALVDLYARLKGIHCKHILQANRDDYLNALLGFVICPKVIDNSWKITFDDFSAKIQDLTAQYRKGTTQFPIKYHPQQNCPTSEVTNAAKNKLFVSKIHDINYAEVIPDAIENYLYASKTVLEEFKNYEVSASHYELFADDVLQQFHPAYRKALREVTNVILHSKNFYDSIMIQSVPNFRGFETPNSRFRNGVLHMHCDDPTKNLKWKLEDTDE